MTDTRTQDERYDQIAPSGTVEFYRDEQVDLHVSDLARITAEAVNLAEARHDLSTPTDFDAHRIEFGRNVVGTIGSPVEQARKELDPTNPVELARIGAALVALRIYQLRQSASVQGE